MKLALLSAMPLQRISASHRRRLAVFALATVAVAIGACSGNGSPTASSNQFLPNAKGGTPSSPPPYTFTFQPVDNAQGGSDSRLTGITEKANVVVGVGGTTPSSYSSWTAHTPYPLSSDWRQFRAKNYPGAGSTYMAAMSNAFNQAGTVFSPPPSGGLACTTCGIVFNSKGSGVNYGNGCGNSACLWTFIQDPNEGSGDCAVTEVLGISGNNTVVGYYEQGASSCGYKAFEAYYGASGVSFADFSVPGADSNTAQATGANEEGNVVGTAAFNGQVEGWFYANAAYYTGLAAPGATATYPTGVNWEAEVVGYYVDGQQATHGFVLTDPEAPPSQQVWETVDEPLADNYTVVSHMNTHHYISGWYKDANGSLHGFVGTCTSSNCTNKKGSARRIPSLSKEATHR